MKRMSERSKRYLVKKYLSSGLSQRSFCKEEGINLNSLYNWRKRYDVEEGERKVEDSRFIPIEVSGVDVLSRIESSFKIKNLLGYELEFSCGCRVEELKLLLELCDGTPQ